MWVTGWVRDRDSGREAAMGATILPGLPGKNGGAPSSLTQPQSPHQTWSFCERDLSNVSEEVQRLPHKPFSYMTSQCQDRERRGPTASKKEALWPGPNLLHAMR